MRKNKHKEVVTIDDLGKEKLNIYVVNKCPLRKIVKDDSLINKINEKVITVNKIVIQVYQFLNLFLIDKINKNKEFPVINDSLIKIIIRVITTRKDKRGGIPTDTKLFDEVTTFYNEQYRKCIDKCDIPDSTKLKEILTYEVTDIIKNIEVNIKEHFTDHVEKFVKTRFNYRESMNKINTMKISKEEKKAKRKIIYTKMKQIKEDLLRTDESFESKPKRHNWIKEHRKYIIIKDNYKKKSLYYDICCDPLSYLKPMYYINQQLEKLNIKHQEKELPEIKLFHVIPQRRNIIPKYITIGSEALMSLVVTEQLGEKQKNILKYRDEVWNQYFKTKIKIFKRKNYVSNYMIKTDGVGCSILLIRTHNNKPVTVTKSTQKKINNLQDNQDKEYIEHTKITEKMKNKKIVTIDPGTSDLIYCLSKNDSDEIETFRYTQNQRRIETRNKKYNKLQDKLNKKTKIMDLNKIINDKEIIKSIKELESELSNYNSKTTNYVRFQEYCKKKNKINRLLFNHYAKYVFRKLKFNRYTNTQKSESKMIKNFINKFGNPEDILVVMGDYSKTESVKGKEPTICKRFRKIFRRNEIKVYLVNEYRTSMLCNECHNENEHFLERESHKPKNIDPATGKGKLIKCWGLLRCTNVNCGMIHNRDKNACLNMYNIVMNIINKGERPKCFCRQINKLIPIKR